MPDGHTLARPAPALCSARREILVYLAALDRAGRPAPSLRLVAQETCVTIASIEARKACSSLRAAQLVDWADFKPGTRRDNEVILTDAGRSLALALLQAAGADAPRFPVVKRRTCMGCLADFLSDGPHNRLCPSCNEAA